MLASPPVRDRLAAALAANILDPVPLLLLRRLAAEATFQSFPLFLGWQEVLTKKTHCSVLTQMTCTTRSCRSAAVLGNLHLPRIGQNNLGCHMKQNANRLNPSLSQRLSGIDICPLRDLQRIQRKEKINILHCCRIWLAESSL